MGVNKVVYSNTTLIDLTGDTVTADTLAEGVVAHDKRGERIVGTMVATGGTSENYITEVGVMIDGEPVTIRDDGSRLTTVVNEDESIVETRTFLDGTTATKTTVFNDDDTVTETTVANGETSTKVTTFTDFGMITMNTDNGNQTHKGETEPDASFGINGDVFICKVEEEIPEVTFVEYIESSGSQYINTNYLPTSNNLRVVIDFEYTTSHNGLSLFGNHTSAPYSMTVYGSVPQFYVGSGSSGITCGSQTSLNTRYILDVTANNGQLVAIWNGTTYTATYSGTLYKDLPFFIFGSNANGSLGESGSGYRLYSIQFYDNDAMVRDYVPVIDADGEVCLYDQLNHAYYRNVGTGAFSTNYVKPEETTKGALFMKINGAWTLLAGEVSE